MTRVVHYSNRDVPLSRKEILRNMAVSGGMVAAAQAAVAKPWPESAEYGITDADMTKAIKAALRQAAREAKT
jgi:isocitrate lyase